MAVFTSHRILMRKLCFFLLAWNGFVSLRLQASYDVVIYGGTSAGIAAAVQAKRMGKTAVVIEPSDRIGGVMTGGLGYTDIGNQMAIGGISREFYQDIAVYYRRPEAWRWQERGDFKASGTNQSEKQEDAMWVFEPSVALQVFENWIRRDDLEIVRGERLNREAGVVFGDQKEIISVTMESGKTFSGKMFIDATYEGDLLAAAKVSYVVGREANVLHGETFNGVQKGSATAHQVADEVDPYVNPGNPSSGLLPFIESAAPEPDGSGDGHIQAYNFRMCLTNCPDNRIPFAKPEGYNESWYELLFRNLAAQASPRIPWINSAIPNRKTDTNNRDGVSTDFIGQNYDYPEASYAERKIIVERHRLYQQGLMWTLANHPRIPQAVRDQVKKWGLCRDEFLETGGWPSQIYVREARRMIGAYIMTQANCQGVATVDDSIGLAAYTMDSHHARRYVSLHGFVRNEGDVQVKGFPPYPISFRSIVPKKEECRNLLVPICLSATHIAYGSIRMEPVFMILGQSAATAAVIAIDANCGVQDVDYRVLRLKLLNDMQRLKWKRR